MAFVVVDISIHDPKTYDRYKTLSGPSMVKFGGKFLMRGGTTESLEGDWKPDRFVILEFPSADAARAWWASPEYAEAKALRHQSASTRMVLADGPAFDPAKA